MQNNKFKGASEASKAGRPDASSAARPVMSAPRIKELCPFFNSKVFIQKLKFALMYPNLILVLMCIVKCFMNNRISVFLSIVFWQKRIWSLNTTYSYLAKILGSAKTWGVTQIYAFYKIPFFVKCVGLVYFEGSHCLPQDFLSNYLYLKLKIAGNARRFYCGNSTEVKMILLNGNKIGS